MNKLFLIVFVAVFFTACNKEDAQLNSIVKIATVSNPQNLTNFQLTQDDSVKLWVVENKLKYYRPKDKQRVIVNYSILSTKPIGSSYKHDVLVNDIYEILTKDIFDITSNTQDSIGNDPIHIHDMWVSNDFLNVEFSYLGFSKMHFINLVRDASKTYTDNKVHLEFRHNANNDYPSHSVRGIVSFRLDKIRKPGVSSVEFVVHTNEFSPVSSQKTYSFTYKYHAPASSPVKQVQIPVQKATIQ